MFGARSVMRALGLLLVLGCRKSEVATTEFSDPLVGAIVVFDEEDAVLAEQLVALEAALYTELQVDSRDAVKRSLLPPPLTDEDVDHLEPRPDRDVADAISLGLAWASPYELEQHARLPVLADQRPLEPSSPDHFDREFLEGLDCWQARGCAWLRTFQDLTKVYTLGIIPPITYEFYKDFRWVNLAGDGEEERWMVAARSWSPQEYFSENEKNALHQSYTLELWFPRDGAGWLEGSDRGGDWGDSAGGGTLRFLALWTEADMGPDVAETTELGVIRWGMDGNMKAHDKWLEANP